MKYPQLNATFHVDSGSFSLWKNNREVELAATQTTPKVLEGKFLNSRFSRPLLRLEGKSDGFELQKVEKFSNSFKDFWPRTNRSRSNPDALRKKN